MAVVMAFRAEGRESVMSRIWGVGKVVIMCGCVGKVGVDMVDCIGWGIV